MKNYIEYPVVFFTGGIVYMLIELTVRAYTHVTMGILGGLCFIGIYYIEKNSQAHLLLKAFVSALMITMGEFGFGVLFNLSLGLGIWDYSDRFLNLYGQICPLFTCFWFLLSIIAFYIARLFKRFFAVSGNLKMKTG